MPFVCKSYVLVCHNYVICMSLVSTRMPLVCHSYVLICYLYVLVCHSYVTRMWSYVLVCHPYVIRMSSVCHSYNEGILQVEHGSFTPLVMLATSGMSRESEKFYSRLAEIICIKRKTDYNVTITWVQINCILVNKITWNMHTWESLSFSECQPGDVIKRRRVHT